MKSVTSPVRKGIVIAVAAVCLVVGAITAPTPLPTGVPLIALGIVLLVSVSATARDFVRKARQRYDTLDRGLVFVETRTGRNMATMLKRTRPLSRKIAAKSAMKAAAAAMNSVRARIEPSKE